MEKKLLSLAMLFVGLTLVNATPQLYLSGAATNPSPVMAGQNFALNFNIMNSGNTDAQGVTVTISAQPPFSVINPNPTAVSNIPYNNQNPQYPYQIPSNSEYALPLSIEMHAANNAQAGVYALQMTLTYHDTLGNPYQTVQTVNVQIGGEPSLSITASSLNPVQVQPDQTTNAELLIQNNGADIAQNTEISFQFQGVASTPALDAGTIQPYTSSMIPVSFKFYKNATIGTISALASYSDSQGNNFSETIPLNVNFELKQPEFQVESISSTPSNVYPNNYASLNVLLYNNGDVDLKNVNLYITSGNVQIQKLSQQIFLGDVPSKTSQNFQISFYTPKNSVSGSQFFTVNATFDYYNQTTYQVFQVPLEIKPIALFKAETFQPNIYPGESNANVIVQITNIGSDDARNLIITTNPNFPFTTDAGTRYIQDLKPGQSQNISFSVSASSTSAPGSYQLEVDYQFKDAQQNTQTDYNNIPLSISGMSLTQLIGNYYWIIIVIVIIAIIYFARMRKKK
jgi:hypothetical protein